MSPPDAWLPAAEAVAAPEPVAARRVGWRFIALYASAYTSTCLLFLAPLLVTLALKILNQDGRAVCRARVEVLWRRDGVRAEDPFAPAADGFVPLPL